jgi:NAD(P)-dependent dehydrogenase (short-subunit alcohol dehydrogenase family)
MALPKRTMNSQGLELQIATNYFGPFLLTALLFPLMKEEEGSRIVTVSSTVARTARLEFDNLHSERRYVPHSGAYTQSKLVDLIFASELHRGLSAANSCIASIAAHPGWALTDLGRSVSRGLRIMMKLAQPMFQSPKQGHCHCSSQRQARMPERVVTMARMVGGRPREIRRPPSSLSSQRTQQLKDAFGMNQSGLQVCNS